MRSAPNDDWTISDFLDRRALVKAVASVIATWDPPLTVGIYGPWGEGKTSTMRMIQAVLEPDPGSRDNLQQEWSGAHGLGSEGTNLPELGGEEACRVAGTVWFDPWRYQSCGCWKR